MHELLRSKRALLRTKAVNFDDVDDCAQIIVYDRAINESYNLYDPSVYVIHGYEEKEIITLVKLFRSIYTLLRSYAPQFVEEDYFARKLFAASESDMKNEIHKEVVEARRIYDQIQLDKLQLER